MGQPGPAHAAFPVPCVRHSLVWGRPHLAIFTANVQCIISSGFVGGDVTVTPCDSTPPPGSHGWDPPQVRALQEVPCPRRHRAAQSSRAQGQTARANGLQKAGALNVLAAGPADAHLRRQVPLWKEAHHHRYLRVAPGNKS